MKKRAIIYISAIVAVIVVAAMSVYALGTQDRLSPLRQEPIVASLPVVSLTPLTVQITDSLTMKFDTGSDISCITPSDLRHLREKGVPVSEHWLPVIGRNSDGTFSVASRRYLIDLPLEYVGSRPDSTGAMTIRSRMPDHDNVLRNAEFVLIDTDSAVSALGIDILQHFFIEYVYSSSIMRLHTLRPEGYQDCTAFRASIWPLHAIWPGRRYYMDLDVDNSTNSYFIDTGLRRAAIKLPAVKSSKSARRLHDDTLVSQLGQFQAKTANVWVEAGNRAGTQTAFYSDNLEEPYSINPFNLFAQDILMDFESMNIALRPYVTLPRRHFMDREVFTDSVRPPRPGLKSRLRRISADTLHTSRH